MRARPAAGGDDPPGQHRGARLRPAQLTAVSGHLAAITGRGDRPPRGQPDYAPRVRKVLGIALREASNLDHGFVGTGHLLLAVVREGQGIATGILQRMGVGPDTVAEGVRQALARGGYPLSVG